MTEDKIAVIVICPDCGKQIEVVADESGSITIGNIKRASRWTSDRPDGGVRGESQQEYFGIE